MKKIIQIATTSDYYGFLHVIALCEDGTIYHGDDLLDGGGWEELPSIPDGIADD